MEDEAGRRRRSRSRSNTPLPTRATPTRGIDIAETITEQREQEEEELAVFTSPPAHRTRNALKQRTTVEDTPRAGAPDDVVGQLMTEEQAQNLKNYSYEYEQITTTRTITSNKNGSNAYNSYIESSPLSNSSRNNSRLQFSPSSSDKSNDSFVESVLADSSEVSKDGIEHLPYRLYKFAVEYWKRYPKTDYTYSHLSRDRVELAPGQIAVPNMSRLSLNQYRQGMSVYNGGLDEQESAALLDRTDELRRRWNTEKATYSYSTNYSQRENFDSDSDEIETSRTATATENRWLITRFFLSIFSLLTTTMTTIKNKIWKRDTSQLYPFLNNRKHVMTKQSSRGFIASTRESIGKRKWWLIFFLLLLLPLLYYYFFGLPLLPFYMLSRNVTIIERPVKFELTDEMMKMIVLQVKQTLIQPEANPQIIERVIETTVEKIDPTLLAQQQELIDKLYLEIGILKGKLAENEDLNDRIVSLINKHNKELLANVFEMEKGTLVTPESVKLWLENKAVNRDEFDIKVKNSMDAMAEKLNINVANIVKAQLNERLQKETSVNVPIVPPILRDTGCDCDEHIDKIVNQAIQMYDADKTGQVDYALESAGGQVISTRCTEQYHHHTAVFTILGFPVWYPSNSPRTVLQPGNNPGECWAFQGFPGYLVIKLHTRINVTGFTLEHMPAKLSPNGKIESAPKNFTVLGLQDVMDRDPVVFGAYEYSENSNALQYYPVLKSSPSLPNVPDGHDIVELRIDSNHGDPRYTCVYRFRVHGDPVGDTSNGNIPER